MSPSAEIKETIKNYLDSIGRVSIRPSKKSKQMLVIAYLAQKIPGGRVFNETQINDLLKMWHTFGNSELLLSLLFQFEYISSAGIGNFYVKR